MVTPSPVKRRLGLLSIACPADASGWMHMYFRTRLGGSCVRLRRCEALAVWRFQNPMGASETGIVRGDPKGC